MLVVVLFCAGNAMAAAVDILTFPDNNDTGVGSYTATWTATTNEKIWTISGFNNNNNKEWAFIKSGSNKTETTSTITTPAYDVAVSDIVFTVDFTGFVTSATVEVLNGEEVVSTVDIYNQWKKGEVDAKVSGAAGNSYRLTIVNAQTVSNGMTQISQVAVYEAGEYTAPTVEDLTAVDNKFWNFSDFTAGDITEPTVVDNLELYGTSSKKFTIDSNNKSIDDIDFTGRLKTGGTGAPDGRYIRFKVAPNSVITVYGMSGSSGNERTLNIDFVQFGLNEASLVNDGNAIGKVEYEYTGTEEADVYIYSTNSGFNIYGIKVEAIKYTVNVSASENGTVEADVTEAAAGATVKLTVTPAEGCVLYALNVKYLDEAAEQEVSVSDDNSFVMPAADVTVTAEFRAKNEPGEYDNTPLTKDMFKGWDGFDDYAKVNKENPYWNASELPADIGGGATVFGSSNVTNTDYADITGAETLRITGTPGIQLRVMFNRQSDNSLTELNPTIGEEGYVDVDLSEYEYVHLNAIKTGWESAAGTVESIILNPGEEEEDIDGENWTFDENPEDVITVTTQGYQRNIPEGSDQIAGLQPVTGWTPAEQTESDPGFTAGIFAYGSENLLNNKVAAPAAAPEGSESPSALALSAVWGGVAQYTQPITLPEGSYKFTYVVNNGANTGAVTKNLFGFIAEDGTEYLSDKTTFTVGEWTTEEVTFTLDQETTGDLTVGFIGAGGSGNAPHLFVDYIDLEMIDDADVAKDELEKAIAAAQAKDYVIGDELFQYPQSEIDPLDEAIAAAQEVYDNEDATTDEVNAATEALNSFIENFNPAYNEPEDGQPYIMNLTTSDGQFPLAIDGTSNKIVAQGEGTDIYFDKQDDGTWGIKTEDGDYVAYAGSNPWTMSTSTEPYGWTITALPDGGVSITGENGLYGTNASDGNAAESPVYGDKTTSNGNYIWNIEPVEEEPEGTMYNGTLTQTLTHPQAGLLGEDVDNDYNVFITDADDNGNVKIQFIDGFTFPVMGTVIPDLIVDAVKTTNEDGSVTYTNETFTVSVQMGQITVNYNCSLTGTQENADATPTITLVMQNASTNTVVFGPREEDSYLVRIDDGIENGEVVSDVEMAKEGDTVTFTVTPDNGYEIDAVSAYYFEETEDEEQIALEQKELELTAGEDGSYSFTMPAADVTLSASFKEIETGLSDYEFVATEWQAGDPGRISADNVTVDEAANTITVDKTGAQNVNLQYKGQTHYNVAADKKYFVVQGTGMAADSGQLWWMNNDWIGTISPQVYSVGDETLFVWDLSELKKEGGSGEPVTLASDTDDAEFWNDGGWSTCFGLTLIDPDVPAVITDINFTDKLPDNATAINRININGADFAATIDNALRNGKVFDISGRKVSSVVKGGIYIVDGQKMVIRK